MQTGNHTSKLVIVTGAAGFIGNRLSSFLTDKGYSVIGVDHLEHFENRNQLKKDKLHSLIDRDNFFEEFPKDPIAAIFHLGACTDTTELRVEYLKNLNTEYSKKLWALCFKNKIPFIYASSAATYGNGEQGYIDDEKNFNTLVPLNPYGQSKLDFDIWALEQEKKNLHPPFWSGFKFFNVYGYGESHKGKMASVIYHAYNQINSTGTVKLFKSHKAGINDGHQKRDFISVEDVIKVLFFAFQKPIKRGVFNLGTGLARTFLDLVHATFDSLKVDRKIDFIDTPIEIRERYQYFTQAEMNKLKAEGYTDSFLTLEEGVQKYINALNASSKL